MRERHILELIAPATRTDCRVQFVTPRGARETTFAELWAVSSRGGRIVKERVQQGRVGGLLTPSGEMIAVFIGCLRAGRDFVSLPLPGRGQSPQAYAKRLDEIVRLAEITILVVEDAYAGMLQSVTWSSPLAVVSAESLLQAPETSTGSPFEDGEPGELVQFSSGTTGAPKGVRLTGQAIGASVEATLNALGVSDRPEVFCAWLPLSHDMGLIGGLLGSWVGCTRTGPGYRYVCISPELFLAKPSIWLEMCSASKATVTAAPTFAYSVLSRHLPRCEPLDLSHLRAAIVGAEPIGKVTLEAFAAQARRHGFREQALCPAYGLAEATLAVSMVRPSSGWSSREIVVEGRAGTYVSCGCVLDCVNVAAPGIEQGAGPIRVAGAARCVETIPPARARTDHWLDTGDLGVLADGELFVTGRSDDLICVAGRNIFAWELESALSALSSIREGDCAIVTDGRGGYAVLFELRGPASDVGDVVRDVRKSLASKTGTAPSAVGCLPRGTIPKTPSGKVQRNQIAANWRALSRACLEYKEF
jgi:acyl-CoA synthetase (AMP-forming)/AMP-acid ligase II